MRVHKLSCNYFSNCFLENWDSSSLQKVSPLKEFPLDEFWLDEFSGSVSKVF